MNSKADIFADNLLNNISSFFIRNRWAIITSIITGLLVYGVEIFNVSLSIDEEVFGQISNGMVYGHQGTGRWGLILLWYILPDISMNYLSPIITILFLTLSAVLLVDNAKIPTTSKVIFTTLFVSSPYFIFMQAFVYQGSYVSISIFLVSIAVLLFYNGFKNSKLLFVPSIILFTIGIGCYQSLLSYFATALFFIILIDYFNGHITFKQSVIISFSGAIVTILSLGLYYLVIEFTIKDSVSTYSNVFFKWGLIDPIAHIGYLFTSIYRFIIGIRGYPPLMYLAFSAIILAAINIGYSKKDNKIPSIFTALGLLIILFFLSISLNIAFGGFTPYRTQIAPMVFFAAGITIYSVYSSKFEKLIIYFCTIVIIISSSSYASKLFLSDYRAEIADRIVAERVLDLIYDKAPEFYEGKIPVAFIGEHNYGKKSPFLASKETLGASFWNWDSGNPHRMSLFLISIGVPTVIKLANNTEYEDAKKIAENMPAWPNKDSVQVHNGIVVVKLNGYK